MKLSAKIALNSIIQIISKFLSIFLGLLGVAIITRYLGKEGFGEYTIIVSFLSFFAIASDFGLTLITSQLISKPDANESKIIGNLFSIRLLSAIIFLGLAPIVALFFPYSHEIKLGIAIISLSYLFVSINQIFVGIFQKNLRMDKVSIAEIVSRIFLVGAFFFVYHYNFGLLGVLIATVLSSFINFLFHLLFSFKFVKISFRFDFDYWKEIINKSWPLALTITLNLVYLKTDTILLSVMKKEAEVGLYGSAYKVIDILITIPFMFAGIILPILTKFWAENSQESFKNILQKSFDIMAILSLPLIFGTQLVASQVMVTVAGYEFYDAGKILQILIIANAFIFLGNIFSHAIIAVDEVKKLFKPYFFVAISSVILYIFFIQKYSYFGAAWITVYSEFIIMCAFIYIIYKKTKFFPDLDVFFKSLASSIIMYFFILMLNYLQINNLFFILISSIIIYFVFLFLIKGFSKEEIFSLIN